MYNSIKKRLIVLNSILIVYAVFHQIFIFDKALKYCDLISASFMLIMGALSIFLLGFKKDTNTSTKVNIFYKAFALIMLYFIITYLSGLLVGFNRNAYSSKPIMIFKNIFAPIVFYICIEIYRYVNINSINKNNKLYIFITAALSILEILVIVRFSKIHNSLGVFKAITLNIIPIIITNFVMSVMCRYSGLRTTIFYRLIMNIYIYLVPIMPNISDFINSVLYICFPLILYKYTLNDVIDKKERIKTGLDISSVVVWTGTAGILLLISGLLPLCIVGVASESMSPKIDKGDAVVYKKIKNDSDIKVGDILVFKQGDKTIIHRLVEKKIEDNTIYYVTKGDANNTSDGKEITIGDIKGVVSFNIKFIAYPSIFLNDLIKK